MKMVIKRLLWAIPLLLGITFVSFLLIHLAPGDPASVMMNPNIKGADLVRFRHNLGLDRPIWVQYGTWLSHLVQGNFGVSYVTGKPVLEAIFERMPATLFLSVSSLIFIVLITLPLGIFSAAKEGRLFDQITTGLCFFGFSIPTFWLGLVFILVFSQNLGWFPTSGFIDPEAMGFWQKGMSLSQHLFLPLLTIVVTGMAGLTRYQRSEMSMVLKQPYILAARARGISENRILFKHAFKNAALPLITLLGMELPGLVGGAFVIEYIFAWPGMGQLGIAAALSRDYPVLMGTLLMTSVLIIIGNLLADVTYALADPGSGKPR